MIIRQDVSEMTGDNEHGYCFTFTQSKPGTRFT